MVSHHRSITEFSGITEDWATYMEQLESYFMANNVTTGTKKHDVAIA